MTYKTLWTVTPFGQIARAMAPGTSNKFALGASESVCQFLRYQKQCSSRLKSSHKASRYGPYENVVRTRTPEKVDLLSICHGLAIILLVLFSSVSVCCIFPIFYVVVAIYLSFLLRETVHIQLPFYCRSLVWLFRTKIQTQQFQKCNSTTHKSDYDNDCTFAILW